MWKLRFLGKIRFFHRFIRKLFSFVFSHGKIITIPFGILRGTKWVCSQGEQFWYPLGLYEKATTTFLAKHLRSGNVFFDIGANFGYYTLLGSRVVGSHGKVYAFEPIDSNVTSILEKIKVNNFKNVFVEKGAVSNLVGDVDFVLEPNNASSHLSNLDISNFSSSAQDIVSVPSVSLDYFVKEKGIFPDLIKMDIEGAECDALLGAQFLLKEIKPIWIIATHSIQLMEDCKEFFDNYDYNYEVLDGSMHELIAIPRGRT